MLKAEKLSQMSHRIFNTTLTEKRVARANTGNPFVNSNFQKNILTEDVFESSKKVLNTDVNEVISSSAKRIYSTFVGSINDFGKKGIESVKEFYAGVKNGVVSIWNKVQEFGNKEINIVDGIKSGFGGIKNILSYDLGSIVNTHDRTIAKLAKMDPQSEIKPMLVDSIRALEADMAIAA